MKGRKKKRGRPSQNGTTRPRYFLRAVKFISSYDEARAEGEKHTSAVRMAIDTFRRLNPKIPMSETCAKRILAEFRPQNGALELRCNYSILEGDEAAEHRRLHPRPSVSPDSSDPRRPLKLFKFGFGKRSNFRRHNAKPRT